VVAAPSKLHRPHRDRVKTDARDAELLTRLLQLGEVVEVNVPNVEQEAARDLVRAREDAWARRDAGAASGVEDAAAAGNRLLRR
jgi:transposase